MEDFQAFIETLEEHFDCGTSVIVTRAPGRLDVMGGIADYSGSLVLQLPIAEATLVALEHSRQREIRIVSLANESDHRPVRTFDMALAELERNGRPVDYSEART